MKLKVGDKAFYSTHGIIEITGIETKSMCGSEIECYILNIITTGAKMLIPVANSEKAGVRSLLKADEIDGILNIVQQPAKVLNTSWNKRFKDYSDRMRTGDPQKIASVLRDLGGLQKTKELSFGEKQLFQKTKDLVVEEISFVQNTDPSLISSQISGILNNMSS